MAKVGRICTVEEFFRVIPDEIWILLPECYPIIGIKSNIWTNNERSIKNTLVLLQTPSKSRECTPSFNRTSL